MASRKKIWIVVINGGKYHFLVRYKCRYLYHIGMSKKEQESSKASPSQIQRGQQEAMNRTFDQTRNSVKKTVSEAQKDVVNRTSGFPEMFSPTRAEVCGDILTNIVDNFVTATRVANKMVFANAELVNTSLQQARNNVREFSKIGVNAARNIHQIANEFATR